MSSSTHATASADFNVFWHEMATAARLGEETAGPDTRIQEDLGLDSLQMLELVLAMEELGAAPGEDELGDVETVGDLYNLYLRRHPGVRA